MHTVMQIPSVAGAILDVTDTPSFPCMQIVMHEGLVVVCLRPARVGAVFDVAARCRRCVRQNSIASHRPERASTMHESAKQISLFKHKRNTMRVHLRELADVDPNN